MPNNTPSVIYIGYCIDGTNNFGAFEVARKAREELDALLLHQYVWAGNNPFTGQEVLDLLNENNRLRKELAELKEKEYRKNPFC